MKNFVQPGNHITVPAPSDVVAGAGVMIGALFGVAQDAALTGEDVVLVRKGVFTLPKLEAQAWTVGQKVYWDSGNDRCTTVVTGNKLIGTAVAAAADPSTEGNVLLDGAAR